MSDYIRVGAGRINPVPRDIPFALAYFETYFVCVNTLIARCRQLLQSFLSCKYLEKWTNGIWLCNYIDSLKCSPRENIEANEDQSLTDIMRMCKSLVSTMSDDNDTLEKFVFDALDKSQPSDLQTLIQTCDYEIGTFISQLSRNSGRKNELSFMRLECFDVIWTVFWKCFFGLQHYCRNKADAELLIRSWRHIPQLLSGVLIAAPETIASKVLSGLRKTEQQGSISGECIPYAFWLCSQLVYVNYQRVSVHHTLSLYNNAEDGKHRRLPRLSDMQEVSSFEYFLRKLRENNLEEIIDAYFDAVQNGNRLIQEYAFFDVRNIVFPYVRDVLEEEPPMFLVDSRRSEFITAGYNKAYETMNECAAQLRKKHSEAEIETKLLRLTLDPAVGSSLENQLAESQDFVLRRREEYLALKCVMILLRSWSQGFAQGHSVISLKELRQHSLKMKRMIRDLCDPLRKLLKKLVAQLEVTSGINTVNLSFTVALKIAADVENDVKEILMLALQILNERAKFKAKVDARRDAEATRQGKANARVRERHRVARALYGIV